MSNAVLPITLNKGLNTVVPPLMAEPGTLIDVLNYEVADTVGYRRIDGFEAYDGYPNGAISSYFRIYITAVDPLDQTLVGPGSILSRETDEGFSTNVAIVTSNMIAGDGVVPNGYDAVLFHNTESLQTTENFLLQVDGESYIQLENEEAFLLIDNEEELGANFYITTTDGVKFAVTVDGTATEGGTLVTAEEYLTNLRSYQTLLRSLVTSAPAPVVGLYWLEDRLLVVVNALTITLNQASANPAPKPGRLFRWDGRIYRLLTSPFVEDTGIKTYSLSFAYVRDSNTINNNLVEIDVNDTDITVWMTDVTINGSPSQDESRSAYMGYYSNLDTGGIRGFIPLTSSVKTTFANGNYASAFGPPITFGAEDDPADAYYVIGDAGATVLKVRLNAPTEVEGEWTAGTATGILQFIVIKTITGTRDYPMSGDALYADEAGTTKIADITGEGEYGALSGNIALDEENSKYVWNTYNFYGNLSMLSAYGANGAGRSFWANKYGWGLINSVPDESLDRPKYVAFHQNSLVLGYRRGSLQFSVAGEPQNFNGLEGAIEVATGDQLTGLLELPGDSLAVFGKRTIRRIVGFSDNLQMVTISGSSGCLDYTACLVGSNAVFTGVNGITTLEQTAAYGDFAGVRLSDAIGNYIRPRVVSTFSASERGGVAFAYPVRAKNQYRLVFTTGEQIIITITGDGPKVSKMSYNTAGVVRVPYAWSSEIAASGKERLHVSWDTTNNRTMTYELESGWGFNGLTFRHYFDLSHIFFENGTSHGTIDGVRLYGQGYGVATLDVAASGIETDFSQPFSERVQDISIPNGLESLFDTMLPVTNIVDHANWGLGVKLRIQGTTGEASSSTEPSHNCQAVIIHMRTGGARDD